MKKNKKLRVAKANINHNVKNHADDLVIYKECCDKLKDMNLTAQQVAELNKLFSRSALPVKPWGFIFSGVIAVDTVAMVLAMIKCAETQDARDAYWFLAFLGAQAIATLVLAQRKYKAGKQLRYMVDDIVAKNSRQR